MSDFGFLVLAFDPSLLQSLDRVKQDAEKLSNSLRETKMLPGQAPARMPYDRSIQSRNDARERGWFNVDREVVDQLRHYGRA
jgi:LDH2 family malate/lactate/ureidoglycolate dehydrogenase